jgi:hypothetical protein
MTFNLRNPFISTSIQQRPTWEATTMKKLSTLCRTRRIIAVFTAARHWSLNTVHTLTSSLFKIHFNINLPSTIRPPNLSHFYGFLTKMYEFFICHMRVPRPCHSHWFHHPNNIWWKAETIKLLWDFKFSRRRVWSSDLSSGIQCRLK